MGPLPRGRVTFCFTDIEGSTRLFARFGPAFLELLEEHRRIVRAAVARGRGAEVKTEGDGFFLAFDDPEQAVSTVIDIQRALGSHAWPEDGAIKVRIGLHLGEAEPVDGDYVSFAVHEAARIGAAAHGGQILISDSLAAAVPGTFLLKDLGIHELKDLEPMRLHQVCQPDLDDAFPLLRVEAAARGYVPQPASSLIGRSDTVAAVHEVLRRSRLVTVTGPGGVGKTRLALEVASAELGQRADGVWFVDLAPLGEEAHIDESMLDALGVIRDTGVAPREQLIDYLSSRQALIVVDNCEHLVGACSVQIAEILSGCPGISVMATSREPLAVSGEAIWRLGSLEPADARDLFVERAKAVRPDILADESSSVAVAAIAERLDGIPLAIELAAARTSVLSPEQIARRLDDRFRLLTAGPRTASARQRTLEATIDWSYDLLDADERSLLRRLAVFRGSFDLAAAEALGGPDTLDLLQRLIDKSMVTASLSGDVLRYRLLETIRQYASQRLTEAGEADEARTTHLRHVAAWACATGQQLVTSREVAASEELTLELDNIRGALEWALDGSHHAEALEILGNVWMFWAAAGRQAEGLDWFRRAWELGVSGDPEALALAHAGTAHLLYIAQEPSDELVRHAEHAAQHGRSRHPRRWYDAWALLVLAHTSPDGTYDETLTAEAVEIASAAGPPFVEAYATSLHGQALEQRGRHEEALALLERASAIASSSGLRSILGEIASAKAYLLCDIGRLDDAVRAATEGLQAARTAPNVYFRIFVLLALSHCRAVRGDADARQPAMEAAAIARDLALEFQHSRALCELAWFDLEDGNLDDASERFAQVRVIAERLGRHRPAMLLWAGVARYGLAEVDRARGLVNEARGRIEEIAQVALLAGTPWVAAFGANALGWFELQVGDADAAEEHFRCALDHVLSHTADARNQASVASALRGLAGVAVLRGDPRLAAVLSGAASHVTERNSRAPRAGALVHPATDAAARAELGDAAHAAAFAEGRALGVGGAAQRLFESR